MREIEIKVRLADKQDFLNKLLASGIKVTQPVTQHDRVFSVSGVRGDIEGDSPWLRVRTETKADAIKQIFTLKKAVTNQMDSIEHETEILDEAELVKIIGFTPYSDLTKTRQKANYGNGIEICIDSIEGLGDFVEAEKLTEEDADYTAVIDELWSVLERFDAKREDCIELGYDVLMRKKQGLEG